MVLRFAVTLEAPGSSAVLEGRTARGGGGRTVEREGMDT